MVTTSLVAALLLASSSPPAPVATAERNNGARFDLGAAAPGGMYGLAMWRDLGARWRTEATAGLGPSGVQLGAMAKARWGTAANAYLAGVGVSLGLPVKDGEQGVLGFRDPRDQRAIVMPWLDLVPVGYQHTTSIGFVLSVELGATVPLREASWHLGVIEGDVRPFRQVFPSARVGFGFAF
jgi:hypothetical protein